MQLHPALSKQSKTKSARFSRLTVHELRDRVVELESANSDLRTELSESLGKQRELHACIDHAPVGLISLDRNGHIETVNRAGSRLLGKPVRALHGAPFKNSLSKVDKQRFSRKLQTVVRAKGVAEIELRLASEDRPTRTVVASIGSIPIGPTLETASESADSYRFQMVLADISRHRATEASLRKSRDYLEQLAYKDPLTGLPNRTLFADRLKTAIERAQRRRTKIALMYLDLDGFKAINDSYGHMVGDQLLVQLAKRLRRMTRNEDTVARIGGDEFTVLLENVRDRAAAKLVAQKILSCVAEPLHLESAELQMNASIGICMFPDAARSADELLKNADTAMYEAKVKGGKSVAFATCRART